ncbi:MAG: hypothetical protein ACHQKZ_01730 [Solirubrobacterales bacterium]
MPRDWRAAAAMLLVLALALSPRSAAGESGVSLRILWVDTGLGDRAVRDVGLMEAREVLEPFGVGMLWRCGPPATESPEDEIRVVPLARRLGEKAGRRILAATAMRDGPRTVWLDWAGMLWLVGLDTDTLASAPPVEKRRLGVALGRVLAHELIHILLPDLPHASHGLMDEALREPLLVPATLDARSREALNGLVARGRAAAPAAESAEVASAGP